MSNAADTAVSPRAVDLCPAIRGAAFNAGRRVMVRLVESLPDTDGEPLVIPGDSDELREQVPWKFSAYVEEHNVLPPAVDMGTVGRFILTDQFEGDPLSGDGLLLPAASSGAAAGFYNPAAERARVVRGRVAVVTGAAQGFGAEIAKYLVAAGAHVVVADLNIDGAATFARELCQTAGRPAATPVAVDVSDEESVAAMVEQVVAEAGGMDLFVSNAGVLKAGSVKELSLRDFEFVTKVNYTGFFLCTKHAAPVMAAQQRASKRPFWSDIIQINSKSGLAGSNKNGAYAGGKFGGIGLVQSFAMELIEDRIKVNAICPGNFFEGPLWSDPDRGLFVQYLRAGKVPGATTVEDVKRAYESKVLMGRGCTGADVMRALYYVVEQEYETGQAVPVTGGQVMLR